MAIFILDRDFPAAWCIRSETEIAVTVGAAGLKGKFGIGGDNFHRSVAHRFSIVIGGRCTESFAAAPGVTVDSVGMPMSGQKECQAQR
ncbi:hypothetical protein KKHLCK_13825 [Candidatus Electrothrix laxa]